MEHPECQSLLHDSYNIYKNSWYLQAFRILKISDQLFKHFFQHYLTHCSFRNFVIFMDAITNAQQTNATASIKIFSIFIQAIGGTQTAAWCTCLQSSHVETTRERCSSEWLKIEKHHGEVRATGIQLYLSCYLPADLVTNFWKHMHLLSNRLYIATPFSGWLLIAISLSSSLMKWSIWNADAFIIQKIEPTCALTSSRRSSETRSALLSSTVTSKSDPSALTKNRVAIWPSQGGCSNEKTSSICRQQ